ncbi:Sensor histidine kinase YycG [Roseivivax sp. THAF40]|uniref:ATP-binding protein n=1 Tax=unclassified Roseivivax TaxID=2639302 RepID=UPI001268B728|nr:MULTISPECIES: ATP-binding protein [unclassified Roseivivax]QFS83752.1 Sensor histidine kinase YycG [Roseivivax sp. THAF197b]QFT47554.1 Sensor histidine kinase YycG [Roseivivax sp. THAF40]
MKDISLNRPLPASDDARIDEALRQLFVLALDAEILFEEKARRLLRIGCEALNLSLGIISVVTEGRYVVRYSHALEAAPAPGTAFDLSGTYCVHTLQADDVTAFHHVAKSEIRTHPCYQDFGLESYIGVPLRVNGRVHGTLNFSSSAALNRPFSDKEYDLARHFGQWISKEWEHSEAKRELDKKTTLLEAILSAMPDAVVFASPEREIISVNPATETMFGYSASNLTGRQTSALYSSLAAYQEAGEKAYNEWKSGKNEPMLVEYMHQSGRMIVGETHSIPMDAHDGSRMGYLAVIRDATQRSKLDAERDNAISTASHELKTPLTSLKGALRLLDLYAADLPSDAKQLLKTAARNSDRLEALTRAILDAGKLSSQQTNVDREDVSLTFLLNVCAIDTKQFAADNNVTVSISSLAQMDYIVHGVEAMLLQLAVNLATNAIKASPKGGQVDLGLLDGRCGFWVRDRGKGIPEKMRPVLYDRFTKASESSYRFGGGTGLGMSIVKAIVDQHHGHISFKSEIGAGTTFYVELPEVE